MNVGTIVALASSAAPFLLASSCSVDASTAHLDASRDDSSASAGDSGAAADGTPDAPDHGLAAASPVDVGSVGRGQLLLTASGEALAMTGYDFPATQAGEPVFADGWQVRFDHVIATFDRVRLWDNPDIVPTDQSRVGRLVAELGGPWAVDLHPNGGAFPYLDGKESGERAVAFAVLHNENKNGNAPFPTDGTRLAIGFSTVVATSSALDVNLGPDGRAWYAEMVRDGCVALYVGQATWQGDRGRCSATTSADGGILGAVTRGTGQEPEFANIPKVVGFDLCFKPRTGVGPGAVETSYVNCDNPDNDPAVPLNGEPHQRGIAFKSNTYSVGEVTFHTDHPFWESTEHDTPAHFDQFAALAVSPDDGGLPTVHMQDTVGVDYTAFQDRAGNVLPWRICDPSYTNPNGGARVGPMHFDPVAVPHCANDDSATGLCDYYDFSKYNQSTQGHWNGADGLCFVTRGYASPP